MGLFLHVLTKTNKIVSSQLSEFHICYVDLLGNGSKNLSHNF